MKLRMVDSVGNITAFTITLSSFPVGERPGAEGLRVKLSDTPTLPSQCGLHAGE